MNIKNFTLLINGENVEAGSTFPVDNPATQEQLANCPAASTEQLNEAIESANIAFKSWSKSPLDKRRKVVEAFAQIIQDNLDDLAALLSQEQGKPIAQARSEVKNSANYAFSVAKMDMPNTVLQDDEACKIEVKQKPIGVIAAICPWNFPFYICVGKIVMPILLGNTVVLKPSPFTPLSTAHLGALICSTIPKGVVNIVPGGNELGAALTAHPLVRKISFTGSVPTGIRIAEVAAKRLIMTTLELGGNDASIVLPDTDVDAMAEKIFWGAFFNCGQVCIAIKRLYVHEDVFDSLVERLVELAKTVKVGDGLDAATQIGPLCNQQQLDIVEDLVNDAQKNGASIRCGGKRMDRKGYFFEPTIITDVLEGFRIVDEEQFGPVLPIIKYKDLDEVISRANNTNLGLGASVWTSDIDKGTQIAQQLESGMAWVNTNFSMPSFAPFGGVKHSGVGREGGVWGIKGLTETQAIYTAK